MGKYQEYPQYKDSSIDLLGDVPRHWPLYKLGYVLSLQGGCAFPSDSFGDEEGMPIVRMNNIFSGEINLSEAAKVPIALVKKEFLLEEHDVVMGMSGSIENLAIVKKKQLPCAINQRVGRFQCDSNKIHNSFVFYFAQTKYFKEMIYLLATGTAQLNISSEQVESLRFGLPSIEEQLKISNFLDHETAKIDTLIEKQQQLIKLLKEKRQAVISHAVTKGLNPSAPMRDSGIEWLGKVPEHWDVNNINYVLNAIGDVDHYMPQSVEKGIPYVMTGDLKELASSINFKDCKQVSQKDYLKLSKKIKSSRGDVIMARYATIGTASYIDLDADFLVSYSCVTIKPNLSKVFGLYLFYYFKSDAFLQGIQNQINTNTQGNVGVNDLKKVKVALPTLAEQSKIIEYLQSKISKLNSISDRSQAAIDLMEERKTALISAAVTGKIDVRSWVAPAHPCARDISASMHVTTPESSPKKTNTKETVA